MTVTITRGSTIMYPALVLDGYESTRQLFTRVHDVIGQASPDITFGPARLRSGRIRYAFTTEAAAIACEIQHAQPGTLTLVDDAVSSVQMDYVAHGDLTTRLDPGTGWWVLTVEYQEIT